MNGRDREDEWDDVRPDRARQPLGPDGIARQRKHVWQQTRGIGRGEQRAGAGPGPSRARPEQSPLQPGARQSSYGNRSRFIAVLVLVVAAVIVTIGGIAATSGDAGSGSKVPISILPFPQSTDTTIAQ